MCTGQIRTSSSDFSVQSVTGDHIVGLGNDQVTEIVFSNVSMEVMPKNLFTWFKNFREFGIANIENFPNFYRGMFEEYTYLTYFYGYNLPLVTEIPKDAFWDMRNLTHFYLDGMRNMRNFDSDFLLYARNLEYFSARGPNQITQISPGFFRNQMRTLNTVDFRDTKLARIGFSVFENFGRLKDARFVNSGCLNRFYFEDVSTSLTADIRTRCVNFGNNNEIYKNQPSSSSSSESTY